MANDYNLRAIEKAINAEVEREALVTQPKKGVLAGRAVLANMKANFHKLVVWALTGQTLSGAITKLTEEFYSHTTRASVEAHAATHDKIGALFCKIQRNLRNLDNKGELTTIREQIDHVLDHTPLQENLRFTFENNQLSAYQKQICVTEFIVASGGLAKCKDDLIKFLSNPQNSPASKFVVAIAAKGFIHEYTPESLSSLPAIVDQIIKPPSLVNALQPKEKQMPKTPAQFAKARENATQLIQNFGGIVKCQKDLVTYLGDEQHSPESKLAVSLAAKDMLSTLPFFDMYDLRYALQKIFNESGVDRSYVALNSEIESSKKSVMTLPECLRKIALLFALSPTAKPKSLENIDSEERAETPPPPQEKEIIKIINSVGGGILAQKEELLSFLRSTYPNPEQKLLLAQACMTMIDNIWPEADFEEKNSLFPLKIQCQLIINQ